MNDDSQMSEVLALEGGLDLSELYSLHHNLVRNKDGAEFLHAI